MNILPLTYLGNIQYFSKLCFSDFIIDVNENFQKQSYRNRCDILSANGPMQLIVNVSKGSSNSKSLVKDIRIDYSKKWQHQHWQSIVSAYKNSPYFDHYAPELRPFYEKRFEFLIDLNLGLLKKILFLLNTNPQIVLSEKYIQPEEPSDSVFSFKDWRNSLSPKPRLRKTDNEFSPYPYWQVFIEKNGFVANMSIIDLLFCEGPSSLEIIKNSVNK